MTRGSEVEDVVRRHAVGEALDDLSKQILRDSRIIEKADNLVAALEDYIQVFVRKGSGAELDQASEVLIRRLRTYREAREASEG